MNSGLYICENGDILEYYEGHGSVFNITKGRVEPVSSLDQAELFEFMPEAA
jgi:hypothetical protein